jgi:hypothetical protein
MNEGWGRGQRVAVVAASAVVTTVLWLITSIVIAKIEVGVPGSGRTTQR